MKERGILNHLTKKFGVDWSGSHSFRNGSELHVQKGQKPHMTGKSHLLSNSDQTCWSTGHYDHYLSPCLRGLVSDDCLCPETGKCHFSDSEMIDSCFGEPNRSTPFFQPKPTRNTSRTCSNIPSTQKVRGESVRKRPSWIHQPRKKPKNTIFPASPHEF